MPSSAPPGYPPVPPGFPAGPAYAPAPATRRPDAKVGGGLLILAGVIAIVGAFLAWVTVGDESGNGFDDYVYDGDMLQAPGALSVIGAAVLIGFGLALFFAGRVLVVAILATIAASIGVLLSAGVTVIMSDIADDYGGDLAIGAILQPVATLIGLAGAIASLVMRKPRPI
jgi:hypothetical protein